MVSGNGFFRLESDTSRTAARATLYQWQNNEWVLVGYHSKRLPDAVCNYGVTELELTGLLANIHGFEQKLNNNYFEAIVDHKAIDFLIKSKHEPVDRYEPPKTTKKANKAAAVAKLNERQYVNALQEIPIKALTRNENPLKKLEKIDKPLTIKQDQ